LKKEFLRGLIFDSLEDAQAQINGWVDEYNSLREHQSLGDRPPAERFALARREPLEPPSAPVPASTAPTPRLIRRVRTNGTISLLNAKYHVGRYLSGQNVEVRLNGGLVEVFFDSVLVANHARKHPPELDDSLNREALASPAARPSTDSVVIRKVDKNGAIRFAGTAYFVGQAHCRHQVEVALLKDTLQIWGNGKLLRTHPIRHDRKRSTVLSPIRVVDPTASMQPEIRLSSLRCRSRSVARVPELHRLDPNVVRTGTSRSSVRGADHGR
jgi:hypothetical protein